jgi:hypothetical protein
MSTCKEGESDPRRCHRHRWPRLDRSSDESGFGQLDEAVLQNLVADAGDRPS